MFQRDGQLVTTGGWLTDAHSIDTRVVVPSVPAEVNITTASETLQVWQERLVRQDKSLVRNLLGSVEINMSMAETEVFCDGCVLGTAIWKPSTPQSGRSLVGVRLIHADFNGPMSVKWLQVSKCCVCIKDGYSKCRTVTVSVAQLQQVSHSYSKCRTVTVSVAQLQQLSHSYSKCRTVTVSVAQLQ